MKPADTTNLSNEPTEASPRWPVLTNVEKHRKLKFALLGDASNAIYLNLATAGSVMLLFMEKMGLDKTQMGVLLAAHALHVGWSDDDTEVMT